MTASDLIGSSLRLLGVAASGESLAASEATDGLSSLNDLLDSWSTENLLIPNKVREVFALTVGQQSYTMGSGGNFNTARPMKIENALIQLPSASPIVELPMDILNQDQYAGILIKTNQSSFPLYLFPDGAFPLDSLNVWPVPSAACSIVLYSWKPLSTLASLTTALSLPPGYPRALRYALAIELAPEYGRAVPDAVATAATESKASIKRMNTRPNYLRVDDSLISKSIARNWITGGFK